MGRRAETDPTLRAKHSEDARKGALAVVASRIERGDPPVYDGVPTQERTACRSWDLAIYCRFYQARKKGMAAPLPPAPAVIKTDEERRARRRAYEREYRTKNRAKLNEYQRLKRREYYQMQREKLIERAKKYYLENRDAVLARMAAEREMDRFINVQRATSAGGPAVNDAP